MENPSIQIYPQHPELVQLGFEFLGKKLLKNSVCLTNVDQVTSLGLDEERLWSALLYTERTIASDERNPLEDFLLVVGVCDVLQEARS